MPSYVKQLGFSLLELITVLGIAGLTAAMALPGINYVKDRRGGEYDARYLAGKLQMLRMEAQQGDASLRLRISSVDDASGVYRLQGYRSAGDIGRGTCYDHVFDETLFDIEWTLKSGYRVYSESTDGICYYPGGSASGGRIYITDTAALYTKNVTQQQSEGDTESAPTFASLDPDMRPGDYTLTLDAQTVRAVIDIPMATGIPDITTAFMIESDAL